MQFLLSGLRQTCVHNCWCHSSLLKRSKKHWKFLRFTLTKPACFDLNLQFAPFQVVFLLVLSKRRAALRIVLIFFLLLVFSSLILCLSLFGISHFLRSIQLGRLEILHPTGWVGGLCRSPSLTPQVAEGTWVVNSALCNVFLRGGPLFPTLICHRSLSIHAPQCLIVSAKSPGSRPDLNNALLPNSDPGFRFSSAHKGILSYCPHLEEGLAGGPPLVCCLLSASFS